MKIEKNKDTERFFNDAKMSVEQSSILMDKLHKYIAKTISIKDEQEIIKAYNNYGVNIKTIEYDKNELLENPYYKNIKFLDIKDKKIHYKNKLLPAKECLNMSYIKYVDNLFKSYIDIGYLKKSVNIPMLYEGNCIWMSPTIGEQRSMDEPLNKANGKVLTFGLGIGYYPYMCLLKNNVESISIVEINKDVIDLFKAHILPQFKDTKKIDIIQGNMYDYYNEEFLSKFDYIFVDVWKDNDDGLEHYKKLMQTGIRKDNMDFWIEPSIIEPIRMLILVYFKSLINKNYTNILCSMKDTTQREFKMVHKYFRTITKTFSTYDELLFFINDISTIRNILEIKV